MEIVEKKQLTQLLRSASLCVLTVYTLVACKPEVHREYITEPCPEEEKISMAQQIKKLKDDGFEIFDYEDEVSGDTIIMQKYFMAFLKSGPNRDQDEAEAERLQGLHMEHLTRMYEAGYADLSGPIADEEQKLQGITVYNVPTFKMADSLANMDPMVKAGRLVIEIKPWWAGKGYPLR